MVTKAYDDKKITITIPLSKGGTGTTYVDIKCINKKLDF